MKNKFVNNPSMYSDIKSNISKIIGTEANLEFIDSLATLPKWKLVKVIKELGQVRKRRFRRTKCLLGDLEKPLPEETYQELLKLVKNKEQIHLAVKLMGLMALRVSEVVKLKWEHLNFETHTATFFCEKMDEWQRVIMCSEIERELLQRLSKFGYVLQSKQHCDGRSVSSDWLRNKITDAIDRTGHQFIYTVDSLGRNRRLFTVHSLRGYGIQKFLEESNGDVYLTRKFARLKKLETTLRYVGKTTDQIIEVTRRY